MNSSYKRWKSEGVGVHSLVALALCSCGSSGHGGNFDYTGGDPQAESLPIARSTQSAPLPPNRDGVDLEQEERFWELVRTDGDWAEYFPTLEELAAGADAVFVGRFVAVGAPTLISGDAQQDVHAEDNLTLEVDELLRGEVSGEKIAFTLSLGTRVEPSELQTMLPHSSVVFLLRKRSDQDSYRVVNGYGIWARTLRHEVDAPMNVDEPAGGGIHGVYADELRYISSLDELIELFRGD